MLSKSEYLESLYNLLPSNYRNEDVKNDYQLKRFLSILVEGGLYNSYMEIDGLLSLIDFDNIPAKYLPQLASALGFEFPYDLDEQTQRTYVKYAVKSYKTKGTKATLEFMIRELTRFRTSVEVDEENKDLDIVLEVDVNRQDFERVVEKVSFIVNEYAPPYRNLNLTNKFIFDEPADREIANNRAKDTVDNSLIKLTTDFLRDSWFITLEGLTNDLNSLVSAEAETFRIYNREEEDFITSIVT